MGRNIEAIGTMMPFDIHNTIRANAMPDAPPNPKLIHMAAMGRYHAIARNTVDAFHTAYGSLELEYKKKYRELRADGAPIKWVMPITYRGYTVHCGYIPVNGRNVFAVHEIDADKVYNIRALIAKKPENLKADVDHGLPNLRDVPLIPERIEPLPPVKAKPVVKEKLPKPVEVAPEPVTIVEKPPKPEKPYSPLLLGPAMAKKLGYKESHASMRATYLALEQLYRSEITRAGKLQDPFSEIIPVTLNGITVRCGYVEHAGRHLFGVHEADTQALDAIKQERAADTGPGRHAQMRSALQMQPGDLVVGPYSDALVKKREAEIAGSQAAIRDPNWRSINYLYHSITGKSGSRSVMAHVFDALEHECQIQEKALRAQGQHADIFQVTVRDQPVRCMYHEVDGRGALRVHIDDAPAIKALMEMFREDGLKARKRSHVETMTMVRAESKAHREGRD